MGTSGAEIGAAFGGNKVRTIIFLCHISDSFSFMTSRVLDGDFYRYL